MPEYDPQDDAVKSYYAAIEAKRARGDADDVMDRLRILHGKLEAEGRYVSANTAWLAIEEITSLRAPPAASDDDGQPDEMTEWGDYDPDC